MIRTSRGVERQVPPIIFILLKGERDERLLKQRATRRKRKRKYTVQSGFTRGWLSPPEARSTQKFTGKIQSLFIVKARLRIRSIKPKWYRKEDVLRMLPYQHP